jgi:hypothetical protein
MAALYPEFSRFAAETSWVERQIPTYTWETDPLKGARRLRPRRASARPG